jgi:hypothetical protein
VDVSHGGSHLADFIKYYSVRGGGGGVPREGGVIGRSGGNREN